SAIPPPDLSEGEKTIFTKLSERFTPSQLRVQDVSGSGCGTFYAIQISSPAFNGLSLVKQHRLVTETLKSEIQDIHGLQV
ncbi:bola-like protein, partial [Fistulina hepatica ATCC 64428]